MGTKILLRIASLLMVFHLVGHSIGHSGWRKAADPVQQEVVKQMTEHEFPFMGATHSIGDYYEGYGWTGSIALVFFALVLWMCSSASAENKSLVLRILVVLVVCLIAWAIDELVFFFPFAASITFAAAVLTGVACLKLRSAS